MLNTTHLMNLATHIARRITVDEHQWDDLASEAMIRAVEVYREKPDAHKGYICHAMKNRCLDILRSEQKHYRNREDIEYIARDREPASIRDIQTAHLRLVIGKAMDTISMTAIERRILAMDADQYLAKEAAVELGISVPAFKSKLYRARHRLGAVLAEAA